MEHNAYLKRVMQQQDMPVPYMGQPDPRFIRPMPPRPTKEAKSALHEAFEILRLGKWYIISVLLIVMAGVVTYTYTVEPVFEASTLMLVDTNSKDQRPQNGMDIVKFGAIDRSKLANQTLILQQSLQIAERTAERLVDMHTLPSTGEPFPVLGTSQTVGELAQYLQYEVLKVKPANSDAGADALLVTATSINAEEAAIIANIYAEEYVQKTEEMIRDEVTAKRIFLEEQVASKKAELDEIEDQLTFYMNREGAVALDEEAKYTVAQIAQMQAMREEARIQLSSREAAVRSLEEELQQLQPRLAQRLASNVDRDLETTKTRLTELEQRVEQIYVQNPQLRNNPSESPQLQAQLSEIQQLRTKVRSLSEQQVDEMLQAGGIDPSQEGLSMSYVANLKRQIADERIAISSTQAKIAGVDNLVKSYEQRLRTLPGQSIELAKLQRRQQAAEDLFNKLDEALAEVRIQEVSERGIVDILRPALPPEKPVSPRKALNLMMGLMLGLMLGIGAAIARRKLDTRVYSPEDLSDRDINMLGVVPDMRQFIKREFGKRTMIETEDGRKVSTSLVSLLAPISPIAEAYRRLYIKLQFSRDEMGIQNLMVTSPKAGAGKSTTSLNLGFTTAQAGKRTLIIDADLRRPSLHEKLGLPEGPTLLELLSEDEARWDSERFFTGIDNVYVITGMPVPQPAELLGSKRMWDLVEQFRTEFDIIIFDTPPVLGAVDPILLSRQCDAVIVVASADTTDKESLHQTLEELRSVDANVLGTVLNRFDPTSMYGYKSTYGYSYGQNSYAASY